MSAVPPTAGPLTAVLAGRPRHPEGPDRGEAERAAAGFEAIFLKILIGRMRRNAEAFGEGLFGAGPGSGIQTAMFDDFLARKLAAAGGAGLKDVLLADWERHGWIPKKADGTERGGLDVHS